MPVTFESQQKAKLFAFFILREQKRRQRRSILYSRAVWEEVRTFLVKENAKIA